MTKIKLIYLSLVAGFCLTQLTYAQALVELAPAQINLENEHICLTTDRSIYIINETVHFKAFYSANPEFKRLNWSTVFYLELIKPDGTPVFQAKYPLNSKGADGSFKLPKDILTGNYFLKGYTKWMRNFSPNYYAYHQLKIINPNNPTAAYINPIDTTIAIQAKLKISDIINDLNIFIDSAIYGCRNKVNVKLESDNTNKQYCISVVKKTVKSPTIINSSGIKHETINFTNIKYYPEINGVSISGKLTNANDIAVSNISVKLSALNSTNFFANYKTDSIGRFFFNIPKMKGTPAFFISSKNDLIIDLDDEFCKKPINIALSAENEFSREEIELIKELSINSQITNMFSSLKDSTIAKDTSVIGFYGQPQLQLFTKDFIELPSLKEFIYELIPQFTLKYRKGIPELTTSIWNPFSYYPILLMVDNIEYPDLESYLKIKPFNIQRIDVIDKGYVIGNTFYGGIINVISKNKDLAGVELPEDSKFFNYKLFAAVENYDLEESSFAANNKRIPDKRNCLYWNPDFIITPNTKNEFSFYTSDNTGKYEIIVQTVSKETREIQTIVKGFVVK